MKRRIASTAPLELARLTAIPAAGGIAVENRGPGSEPPTQAAAPVIQANMISLRVSYQGRIQVAWFDRP